MENNHFTFCPKCGSKNIKTDKNGRHWTCPDCGFELFNNVAASTAVIIVNDNDEVLFEVRAKEPRKGYLALPGGFCEADETAENSARRECIEEIGFSPEKLTYVGSFPNTYPYNGITYKSCDTYFEAKFPANQEMKTQESEVDGLEWHKVDSEQAAKDLPIAFDAARNALLKWLEDKKS